MRKIKDSDFTRGKVPMTKKHIRTLTLEELDLRPGDIVWDIGAGTGSVSVEAALRIKEKGGLVFAIERNPEGIKLIKENADRLSAENLTAVEGDAPSALKGLPLPDKVFIGGSGGNLGEIIEFLFTGTDVSTVVVNAVTLNTAFEAGKLLQKYAEEVTSFQVSVANIRFLGEIQMFNAENPVFIIKGSRQKKSEVKK